MFDYFQPYNYLSLQLEEIRASERNLRIRVKSLTNELALYKRYSISCITTCFPYIKDIYAVYSLFESPRGKTNNVVSEHGEQV